MESQRKRLIYASVVINKIVQIYEQDVAVVIFGNFVFL